MVGVGTLSLPFALRHGWVMLILLFVVYILATAANYWDYDDDHSLNHAGYCYESVWKTWYGISYTYIFIELLVHVVCLVLTGDTLNSIFPQYSQQTFVLFSSIFMIPTALTTRLDFLTYLSFLGMTGSDIALVIVYLVAM